MRIIDVVETCPKCGCDLFNSTIATMPPISRKECPKCGWSWESSQGEITHVPFLDAEEMDFAPIVRCKDCRYYKPYSDFFRKDGPPFCYCNHNNGMIKPKENDFCSNGKKKETED